jgi:hypothetical protein
MKSHNKTVYNQKGPRLCQIDFLKEVLNAAKHTYLSTATRPMYPETQFKRINNRPGEAGEPVIF